MGSSQNGYISSVISCGPCFLLSVYIHTVCPPDPHNLIRDSWESSWNYLSCEITDPSSETLWYSPKYNVSGGCLGFSFVFFFSL